MQLQLQTNVVSIRNLEQLRLRYRLATISGLHSDQPEYFQNRNNLERHLSYLLHQPILTLERDGQLYLAVPDAVRALPTDVALVRLLVQLRISDHVDELDLARLTPADLPIALKFLRFMLQAPLSRDKRLWQPGSGRPFFSREPVSQVDGVNKYLGFKVSPVQIAGNRLGLCVDVSSCYVSATSLSGALTRDEFVKSWKNAHCVYRFGHRWYEIRLRAFADRSAGDYAFEVQGRRWSLLDFVRDQTARPLPSDLAELSSDASVVTYHDNRGVEKGAPAPLCYPIIDTSRDAVARQHGDAILAPAERRRLTDMFVGTHLRNLTFGDCELLLDADSVTVPKRVLTLPDLRFGNGVILRGNVGGGAVAKYSAQRASLLRDRRAGCYRNTPLDRQYLLLPRSVADSFGPKFLSDLRAAVV
jgi:hypothetical protein